MLLFARFVAFMTALVAAINILAGWVDDPRFIAPEWILTAALIVAAVLPRGTGPSVILIGALGYALGVFCVAVSSQILTGSINWALIAIMAVDVLAIWAAWRDLRIRAPSL